MKKEHKFKDWIVNYNKDIDLTTKLFLSSNFIVFVACVVGVIGNALLGFALELILLTLLMAILSGGMFFYVRKIGFATKTMGMLMTLIYLIFMLIFWPRNAGFSGPILIYYSILPTFIGFFLERRKSYISLGIGYIITIIFLTIYYYNESWIIPYENKLVQLLDYTISLFMVAWSVLEIALFYKEQQEALLKELEEKNRLIEIQYKGLQDLDKYKNAVFATLSHDIKTPIKNAKTIFDILLDDDLDKEEKKKIIELASIQMSETSGLVENILYWAKSQMNGLKINKSDFLIKDSINNIQVNNQIQIDNKRLKINLQVSETLRAFGDKEFFEIILGNLVKNAIKFSNIGGQITILARKNADRLIDVQVIDEGIGIPDEKLGDIFNAGESKRGTLNEKGTGLGLKISKLFTELNGGEIYIFSKEGLGSKIGFTIPEF
ncbi:MAG: sensor histidine kinase [Bacteroidia bacterium]